ncbi:MAG: hypothetical protein M1814_002349 [Vezdaea aestivalis]|nr:MAG: hypothetical protein M1814_002349 [Vezdaea aestivalis]
MSPTSSTDLRMAPLGNRSASKSSQPFALQRSASEYPSSAQTSSSPYHINFPNSSTSHLPPPPSYFDDEETAQSFKLPPPRFPIHPREEEGRETLPPYQRTLTTKALFKVKMELTTPFDRAEHRTWKLYYVVLDGPQLKLHKVNCLPIWSPHHIGNSPDKPDCCKPGKLVKRFTLQHAEVGIASDYAIAQTRPVSKLWRWIHMSKLTELPTNNRKHVIRMRAEGEQFLMTCFDIYTHLAFLEKLSVAISLASPLDERTLPRYQTIPRRVRVARDAVQEQARIISQHFPNLGSSSDETTAESGAAVTAFPQETQPESTQQNRGRTSTADIAPPTSARRSPTLTPRPISRSLSVDSLASLDAAEEVDPDAQEPQTQAESATTTAIGALASQSSSLYRMSMVPSFVSGSNPNSESEWRKWCPAPRRSATAEAAAEIRRRRRCQRVLKKDQPRLTDFVVRDGKRWRLDCEKKELVAWTSDLPPYESAAHSHRQWRERGLPEQGF